MSTSRRLLLFAFWLGVFLAALGYIISWLSPLPVAQLGCFLLAAGLSACGIFVLERAYRLAALLLCIAALVSAYMVYRHTHEYLAAAGPLRGTPVVEASNNCVQATPDCALLFIVAQVSGAPDAKRWT
jgi:uncharacterized membrane protein YoaK (UPF0700 family)